MRITTQMWLQLLEQHKAIAVIRCTDSDIACKMAHAVAAGGIRLIEITWNSEDPQAIVARLRAELPQSVIGAGTILNLDSLKDAVAAGAQFAFAPHFDPDLLNAANNLYQMPFVPGVFSPTEMVNAWRHGAKVVKVFPIKSLGGAEYIKCLQAPLNQISLIPTGGITVDNARSMIEAGAIAVGISSSLFPPQVLAAEDWTGITNRTKDLLVQLYSK